MRVLRVLAMLQAVSASAFLVCVWQADRALDKSGIGDPERAALWDWRGGLAFYAFVALWLASVAIVLVGRPRMPATVPVARYVWLPPLALIGAWLAVLV